MSVYYAPGCLAAYAKIKKVVESCFSDRKKRPFVTIIRRGDRLMVTIYHHAGKKTENEILLEDVERLEALYNNLCRLAHWR